MNCWICVQRVGKHSYYFISAAIVSYLQILAMERRAMLVQFVRAALAKLANGVKVQYKVTYNWENLKKLATITQLSVNIPSCPNGCDHGTCSVEMGNTQTFCTCQAGWQGKNCDIDASGTCKNHKIMSNGTYFSTPQWFQLWLWTKVVGMHLCQYQAESK